MRCRVGCYQLVPGPLRAEGDAAEPSRRTLRVGGGRQSSRILCEWRPLEFMPRSGSLCVCTIIPLQIRLPPPPALSPPPPLPHTHPTPAGLCRGQKEVMAKGKRIC